eukprot:CAMPEP_0119207346 /NCGR_PEP_ID=MMETSP1316-20130426/40847_1 /TAXON_ID=41880 /ORGANISM="Pycnococcus provasolii, Strain RCC2336" /LENGTH=118 /DNA_ID=CAMNT_0007203751 /DNA_START=268 /DNA_END=624 /DNA_ORIENTATION=-
MSTSATPSHHNRATGDALGDSSRATASATAAPRIRRQGDVPVRSGSNGFVVNHMRLDSGTVRGGGGCCSSERFSSSSQKQESRTSARIAVAAAASSNSLHLSSSDNAIADATARLAVV